MTVLPIIFAWNIIYVRFLGETAKVDSLAIKGNVAVYKGLFLELPSGHVIIITVYTFPSVYALFRACCTWCLHKF